MSELENISKNSYKLKRIKKKNTLEKTPGYPRAVGRLQKPLFHCSHYSLNPG